MTPEEFKTKYPLGSRFVYLGFEMVIVRHSTCYGEPTVTTEYRNSENHIGIQDFSDQRLEALIHYLTAPQLAPSSLPPAQPE